MMMVGGGGGCSHFSVFPSPPGGKTHFFPKGGEKEKEKRPFFLPLPHADLSVGGKKRMKRKSCPTWREDSCGAATAAGWVADFISHFSVFW